MSLPDIQELQIGINNQFEFKKCTMKQFDKNSRRIDIYLLDSTRQIIEIPSTYIAKFQATKKDGTIVFDDCTITDNKITYIADEQLTTVYGEVECEIGLYEPDPSGDSKKDKLIQSKTFYVNVEKSAMDRNGVISSDAFNTLTIMINSITGISADAEKAIQDMNTAISNVNQTNTNVTDAENVRVSSENTRISNESTRESAENTRISNENTRKTNEESRANAESSRVANENTRTSNESTRETQESTRQSNEAIRQNQEVTRQEYYNAYKVCEAYDNLKAYVVGNKVTYQGSTYQNILASTGILPTNTTNWILIAAKGIDGVGGDMKTSIYDPTGRNTDIFAHDTKDDTVTFAEATTESDIVTGEKHSTLFGKILKSLKTIKTKIGDLTQLQTTSNTDLVVGINELKGSIDTINEDIGDKTALNTTDKSSLVNAINENMAQMASIMNQNLVADIKAKKYNLGDKIYSKLYGGSWWEIKASVTLAGWQVDFDDELHIQVQLKDNSNAVAECQIDSILEYAKRQNTKGILNYYTKLNLGQPVKIACFGDSITMGQYDGTGAVVINGTPTNFGDGSVYDHNQLVKPFPKVLQETLLSVYSGINSQITVENRGYSGDTIGQYYYRHRTPANQQICTMFYGINDAGVCTNSGANPENITDISNTWNIYDFIDVYRKSIVREMLRGSGVILITPHIYYNYNSAMATKRYTKAITKLADEMGLLCINLNEFIGYYYIGKITHDNIHLNDFGAEVVGKRLASIFIGWGYENADHIYGERAITFSKMRDNIITTAESIQNTASYAPPFYDNRNADDIHINAAGGSVYYYFYLEDDKKVFMPIGYKNGTTGKFTYQVDFGIDQPEFILDTESTDSLQDISGSLGGLNYRPKSSKTSDNTGMTLEWNGFRFNKLSSFASHLCIAGKGWHSIKIKSDDAENLVLSGIRFTPYQESIAIDKESNL